MDIIQLNRSLAEHNRHHSNSNIDSRTIEKSLQESLRIVVDKISGSEEITTDDEYIRTALTDPDSVPPLTLHDARVLACAFRCRIEGEHLTYNAVDSITLEATGKAMIVAMIYKSVERLLEMGLLCPALDPRPGIRARQYEITREGELALKITVLLGTLMKRSRKSVAA